jgi:lipopolysaccharide transport system ATP-binding protein
MGDKAIRSEGLGKLYRIGGSQKQFRTLGETITSTFMDPIRRTRSFIRGRAEPSGHESTIWALKDISFEVKRGEVVGIIGNNGAGKSTLLKILSRITEPTEGYVKLYGRVGSLLEVGTGFHGELTGRENIYLNGAILGMSRQEIDRKFDEIVAFSEVEKFINTPVKHYSSGMGLRLGFAVAAYLEPEILIVDEVLAVGDAQFQKKCLGKMSDVAGEGRTILFVSHNMIAVQNLCPRSIQLEGGKIVQDGPTVNVISSYLENQINKTHHQEWQDLANSPGNDIVRLHRIWVDSESNNLEGGVITTDVPISIGVEYWKLVPDTQINVTLLVQIEQQVIAFTTGSSQDATWKGLPRQAGLFRSVCQIPSHFLNVGRHKISILMVQDRSRTIFKLEAGLGFEVVEIGQRDGAWYGREPGVIHPLLPWHSEYLSDQVPEILSKRASQL